MPAESQNILHYTTKLPVLSSKNEQKVMGNFQILSTKSLSSKSKNLIIGYVSQYD